jgi:hypothetical protein
MSTYPYYQPFSVYISEEFVPVAFSVYISGEFMPVAVGSVSISGTLGSRVVCSFEVVETLPFGDTIVVGSEIAIYNERRILIFGGTVDSISERIAPSRNVRYQKISGVDYSQIADRFLVGYAYVQDLGSGESAVSTYPQSYPAPYCGADIIDTIYNNYAGEIVKDIVDRFFVYGGTTENIDYAGVEDGSAIEKAVFNYIPASQAFSDLAELLGWIWYIDFEKNLYFTPRDRFAAPFAITDTTGQWRNMSIERTREQYRNRQYVRAGDATTEPRSNTFVAAAGQTIFEMPFKVALGISVQNGGAVATLGVSGYDDDLGLDFYWSYGSPLLEYRGTSDISGNTIQFTYQGLFPILIKQELDSEIAARAVIEGGTGLYESMADEPQINDQDVAETKALAYLRKYGVIPDIVRFETRLPGLRPGMLIDINVPQHGINDQFLIQSMRIRDVGGTLTWYSIEAVSGDALGSWLDFFTTLSRQAQKFVLYPEEQVTVGEELYETVLVSDAVVMSDSGKPESRTDLAHTDFSELDWVHV